VYGVVVKMLFHQYRETGDKTGLKVIFSPADLEFAEKGGRMKGCATRCFLIDSAHSELPS
jgi:hypothetical protein